MQRLLFSLILIFFFQSATVFGKVYHIQEGDNLIIAIIGQPEYTQTVQVRTDGMISYFGGDLHVAGKTADTVNQQIRTFLISQNLVSNPVIMVSPVPQEEGIFVGGAVATPGRYVISPETDIGLHHAIALAGGTLETADVQQVQLIRANRHGTSSAVETYNLSINRPYRDIIVNVGDLVYVMPLSVIEVQGEVKVPGKLFIRGEIGIPQALAKAGGFTEGAELKALVKISRDGTLSEFSVIEQFWKSEGHHESTDSGEGDKGEIPVLFDGDVLFVPNAFKVEPIYVIGYVRTPGAHRVRAPLSLAKAVALAGGFEERADREHVTVHRGDGKRVEYSFAFESERGTNTGAETILLYPGDILEVKKRFQMNWGLVTAVSSTALGVLSFIIAISNNP